MKNSYSLSTNCGSSEVNRKATLLGYANMILFACSSSSKLQLRTLNYWISPAIDHNQIVFLFDSTGSPFGYVTWAYLASDAENRLLNDTNFLLHPSEWNEGGQFWIIDFFFPYGGVKEAARKLQSFFHSLGVYQVKWARRTSEYKVRKVFQYNFSLAGS
ncbi:toxin-activating lysine-acyltransferase [Pseudomonas sp. nanlin1]|uniref:toxin-activating lysine-acyltransferase n=1 Tax=Pseudomonas sp. nanlin1 TaxID=3040605 RepID=UPI00388FA751